MSDEEIIARGFTPWGGGKSAPSDWDGGEVFCANGTTIIVPSFWTHRNPPQRGDIIGYRANPPQPAESASDSVVVKRMTEAEARALSAQMTDEWNDDEWDTTAHYLMHHLGLILPDPTPYERFNAANPGAGVSEAVFEMVRQFEGEGK